MYYNRSVVRGEKWLVKNLFHTSCLLCDFWICSFSF